MADKFRCREDFVVLVPGEKQSERKGILLPEQAQEDNPIAEVYAVGDRVEDIEVGDHVVVPMMTQMRLAKSNCVDFFIEDSKPALVVKAEEIAVVFEKAPLPDHEVN